MLIPDKELNSPISRSNYDTSVSLPALINIGLNINSDGNLEPSLIVYALHWIGVKIIIFDIKQSTTKEIFAAKITRALTPKEAYNLAADLKQDCIAQYTKDGGALYGPNVEAWGAIR